MLLCMCEQQGQTSRPGLGGEKLVRRLRCVHSLACDHATVALCTPPALFSHGLGGRAAVAQLCCGPSVLTHCCVLRSMRTYHTPAMLCFARSAAGDPHPSVSVLLLSGAVPPTHVLGLTGGCPAPLESVFAPSVAKWWCSARRAAQEPRRRPGAQGERERLLVRCGRLGVPSRYRDRLDRARAQRRARNRACCQVGRR